jgi:hypothetical protein
MKIENPRALNFPQATLTPEIRVALNKKEVPRSHQQVEAGGGRSQGPAQLRVREKNAQDIKAQRTKHTLLSITQ